MPLFGDPGAIGALFQVIMIDLVLAGDNAVVIGLAAAGLPHAMRRKAIIVGVGVQILAITGLLLAGGILLLWVCWKMWQETKTHEAHLEAQRLIASGQPPPTEIAGVKLKRAKTMGQAVLQIILADVSMSLDNVLAVAGAAQHHLAALLFGLALSVALMGFASAFIANLLDRHRWIAYIGLAIIFVVALRMVYQGLDNVTGGDLIPNIPHVSD